MRINQLNREKSRLSFQKAWLLIKEGKIDAACRSLRNSLMFYPRFVPAHILYWEILKDQSQTHSKYYQDYLEQLKSEENEVNMLMLGILSEAFDDKVLYFRNSLSFAPEFFWTIYVINLLIYDQPDLSIALRSVIPNLEQNIMHHYTCGLIYQLHHQLQEAIDAYEKVLVLNKRYIDAHFNLAIVYDDLKRDELAVRHYEKAINYNPFFSDAFFNLGCFYHEREQLKIAVDHYRKAIEIDPYLTDARNNLAVCYGRMDLWDAAEQEFKRIFEMDPKNSLAHLNYAYLLTVKASIKKAMAEFKKAISSNEKDWQDQIESQLQRLDKNQALQSFVLSTKVRMDDHLLENLKRLLN